MKILANTIAVLGAVCLSSSALCSATVIDVNKSTSKTIDRYWSRCVGAGRANEGLRAGWLEQLAVVKEHCGFEYVRYHGLFHDDMFVRFERPDGSVVYNWQYIDDQFDRMMDMGVKPFVELGFFPKDIAAAQSKTQFWWKGNITPSEESFGKFAALVEAFTRHVVERYGIEEVLTWYFEVWNEPNLNPGFWDGTKSQYFRLYKECAHAVKKVDGRLRVGGPSTSNFIADNRYEGEIYDRAKSVFYNDELINRQQWKSPWLEEFLEFCKRENLPVDFVTTHPYPTDYALDPETGRARGATRYVNSTRDDMQWVRKTLENSAYADAEIHYTEWSTSPNSRDRMHDMLPAAAYILKVNLDCLGLCNSLSYWTFTDIFEEKGGGETIFHGGFGMINFQGLVKPSFHAYRMLNALGDEQIFYEEPLFVSRNSTDGKISAVAFNYPEEYISKVPGAEDGGSFMKSSAREVDYKFVNLTPGAQFEVEIMDNNNANVWKSYTEMGSPHSPSRAQIAELSEKAWATSKHTLTADTGGQLTIKMTLSPWACMLIKEK